MRTIICGGKVVMPHRILEGASVLLEDARIAAVYADGRQVEVDENSLRTVQQKISKMLDGLFGRR